MEKGDRCGRQEHSEARRRPAVGCPLTMKLSLSALDVCPLLRRKALTLLLQSLSALRRHPRRLHLIPTLPGHEDDVIEMTHTGAAWGRYSAGALPRTTAPSLIQLVVSVLMGRGGYSLCHLLKRTVRPVSRECCSRRTSINRKCELLSRPSEQISKPSSFSEKPSPHNL